MDHEETGCQAPPEGPILCVNNCGFFGSAATMNMCSKCHKDSMMKQEQAKLAASSFGRSSRGKEPVAANGDVQANSMVPENIFKNAEFNFKPEYDSSSVFAFKTGQSAVAKLGSESFPFATGASDVAKPGLESFSFGRGQNGEAKPEGPKRCTACNKRVGLTGFNCRCGDHFCAVHRYSDKHDCPYDYRTAGRDAIAEANPVVKAEKLEKI